MCEKTKIVTAPLIVLRGPCMHACTIMHVYVLYLLLLNSLLDTYVECVIANSSKRN